MNILCHATEFKKSTSCHRMLQNWT